LTLVQTYKLIILFDFMLMTMLFDLEKCYGLCCDRLSLNSDQICILI
jgi:hypothetical protein